MRHARARTVLVSESEIGGECRFTRRRSSSGHSAAARPAPLSDQFRGVGVHLHVHVS